MPAWTFITRHAATLSLIAQNPRITAVELSLAIGVTERAIRKIIAELYAAGYINKKRVGRGVKYRINPDLPLARDTHHMVAIGDFLESLGWKRDRKQKKETGT